MSELSNDKKVLDEGRVKPLKDADADLRDQIVQKLFDKCEELNVPQKVVTLWQKGSANRTRWLERQKAFLASWDEHLIGNTEGSFEGSSQLHIPMPFTVCKTLHARYLQAVWTDPPVILKARNEASIDRLPVASDVMRYYMLDGANYDKGIEKEVDNWLWRWLTQGSGMTKAAWELRYERFVDVVNVPVPGKPKVQVNPQTNAHTLVPTFKMTEKEVPVTKKTFDGPIVRPVNIEDLLIVGGHGDVDDAEAVIESDWLVASDLWTLSDRKIFAEDSVRNVIDKGPNFQEGTTGADIKMQRSTNAGQARLTGEQDLDRYQILEAYLRMDVDGSGINADIVVWVHAQTRTLMRATYLRRISPKGLRPYAKADFHIREGQEYGVGIPELLFPLSQEMDAMHNIRIDSGLIATMPWGFYRASSGIDPEVIRFEPGALIPVDNPATDVFFPNLGNRTSFGMQEEASIENMVERLTGINDMAQGMMGQQGATRTATGARALVGEMNANLDVHLKRFNRGYKKLVRLFWHLIQKKMPDGLAFRLTGDDGQDYFSYVKTQDDIAGDYDIEVNPSASTSNPAIMQDNAQQVMQVVNNPLAIQMGCVGPGQYYEGLKNFLLSLQIRDYGKYLLKPQGYERQYTPEEEANRILRGEQVPVSPNSDHQGFIDFFQHIHDTDELAGQFGQQQFLALAKQAKLHEQMMGALSSMQGQANNANQMQQNAQQSQQQAPMSGGAPQIQQRFSSPLPIGNPGE